MWKLGKKCVAMGEGDREEGKLEKWAGRYQRRPKFYEKVTGDIPLPNGAAILPHLALSFPEVLGSSKVRWRGEMQCQPITESWIPTSSKELSVLLSMVAHPLSPLSMPTLFHPPFGQLITWYRQACPLEEGKVKHWCLFKVCLCRSWGVSLKSSLLLSQLQLILLLSRIRKHLLSIYTCLTLCQVLLHTESCVILTETPRSRHY